MDIKEAIKVLEEFGVEEMEAVEGGLFVEIFLREELLGDLVDLVELNDKLENS